jgi:hypothetical protein
MESITFVPTYKKIKSSSLGKKLMVKEYSLINNINIILELIIRNTLKFNKLTSTDEIYDNLTGLHDNTVSDLERESEADINTIEKICDIFCENNGVLIKLKKNDECFYKLNYHQNF